MDRATHTITFFEAVDDGYLLAFDSGEPMGRMIPAILALDPWQRYWLAEEGVWWIADDAITLLARRMPVVAAALYAWHERPFDLDAYLADEGWQVRLKRVRRIPPLVAAAYRRLGVEPGAPAHDVLAARRALAREVHPDAGGEHASMVAVNTATDLVLDWLRRADQVAAVTRA